MFKSTDILTKEQQYRKDYRLKNKDKIKAKNNEYYENNKDYWVEYRAKDNNESHNKYHRERKQNDPILKLIHNLRVRTSGAIKKFIGGEREFKTLDLLGIETSEGFALHIESQFEEGMTFENYGTEWELDHIFPISKIDKTDIFEVKLITNYKNIRPSFKRDNRTKSAKIDISYDIVKEIIEEITTHRGVFDIKLQTTDKGVK